MYTVNTVLAEWEYITCPPHKPHHGGEYCVGKITVY